MENRKVFIEAFGAQGVRMVLEKGYVASQFLQAAFADAPSAELVLTPDFFQLSTSHADFKSLIAKGAFSDAVVKAFNSSDARMDRDDAEKRSFWPKLWDYLANRDTVQSGHPVLQCPTTIEESGKARVQINVKRYGFVE